MNSHFQPRVILPETQLEDLYDFLRRFRITDSLRNIAHVSAVLKWEDNRLLAGVPPNIYAWLKQYYKLFPNDRLLHISLARLARFLILAGGNDHREKVLTPGTQDFNNAYNLVNNLGDGDKEGHFNTDFNTGRFMGRLTTWQFPLQYNEKVILGRAYLFFVEFERHDKGYSLNDKMLEYFQLSCLEFIAAGFAIWSWSNGTFDSNPIIDPTDRTHFLTDEHLRRFLQLSSGTYDQYRELLRGAEWLSMKKSVDLHALDPYVRMPAIIPNATSGVESQIFIVPSLKYIVNRASTGIFYLLADKEHDIASLGGKSSSNAFRIAFGNVYRNYVQQILSYGNSECIVVDLDNDFEFPSDKKRPDFAVICGERCVLIEVKVSLLTINARIYFEESELRKEVAGNNLKSALAQIKAFQEVFDHGKINDIRFEKVTTILPIIIGYEDIFVLNSVLLPLMAEIDPITSKFLQLGTITDIEAIGSFMRKSGELGKAMQEKFESDFYRSYAIHTFLNEKIELDYHPLLVEGFESFIGKLAPERKKTL